jgi:DNA-binding NtrC family response regulator
MPHVLIVDDDPAILKMLGSGLAGEPFTIAAVPSAAAAVDHLQHHDTHVMVLDICLKDLDGFTVLDRARRLNARLPIIMITGFSTHDRLTRAAQCGAFDYIRKPFTVSLLKKSIHRALERHPAPAPPELRNGHVSPNGQPAPPCDGLVGDSEAMDKLRWHIGRAAAGDADVLLLGETGTGKELVARALHARSRRRDQPFIPHNCATLPDNLLESGLFGHEKGAFTGADQRRQGKLALAHKGTVFLDEIADLPSAAQAKLLRFLQERQIEPLGGTGPVSVDVRVICASNRDLHQLVAEDRFRADLFQRLNVCVIELPPLRARPDDIPDLARHFLHRHADKLGWPAPLVHPDTIACLKRYPWPGNVRELEHRLVHILIDFRCANITPDCLPPEIRCPKPAADFDLDIRPLVRRMVQRGDLGILAKFTAPIQQQIIEVVLELKNGNLDEAARILGINRSTLWRYRMNGQAEGPLHGET